MTRDRSETRTAVYSFILAALDSAAKQHRSSESLGECIDCIRTAALDACADFAERWNNDAADRGPERRVPGETLALCFHALDFEDRVRASHVSRRWRAAALADCTLWRTFCRTVPADEPDCTNAIVEQLSIMLQRSRQVPFDVELPTSEKRFSGLEDRLVDVLGPELGRIQEYDGTYGLYERLRATDARMRHLRSLTLHPSERSRSSHPVFRLSPTLGVDGAPGLSLLELMGPTLSIPTPCAPLLSLTTLKFHITTSNREYHSLLHCCPNLVSLSLSGLGDTVPLPAGPPPRTLKKVSLTAHATTDFAIPLAAWEGHAIEHMVLDRSRTLAHPLSLFMSAYAGPIHLSIIFPLARIEAADEDGAVRPPWRYIAHIHQWRGLQHLHALHGACAARLVSLWIDMDHLGELLALDLSVPALARLEISLGRTPPHPPIAPGCGLAAPRLRALVLSAAFREVQAENASVPLLRQLRGLLRYDAPLLESITAKGAPAVLAGLGCAELAPLAATYVEVPWCL